MDEDSEFEGIADENVERMSGTPDTGSLYESGDESGVTGSSDSDGISGHENHLAPRAASRSALHGRSTVKAASGQLISQAALEGVLAATEKAVSRIVREALDSILAWNQVGSPGRGLKTIAAAQVARPVFGLRVKSADSRVSRTGASQMSRLQPNLTAL